MPACICLLDEKLRLHGCSPAFEDLIGYTAAEIDGQLLSEYTHPDEAGLAKEAARRADLSGQASFAIHCRLLTRFDRVVRGKGSVFKVALNGTRYIVVFEPESEALDATGATQRPYGTAYVWARDNLAVLTVAATIVAKATVDWFSIHEQIRVHEQQALLQDARIIELRKLVEKRAE